MTCSCSVFVAEEDYHAYWDQGTAAVVSRRHIVGFTRKEGKYRGQYSRAGQSNLGGAVGALKNQRKAARKGQPGQKQVSCWEGHATAITKALILGFASLWFALHEGRKVYELSRHAVNTPRNGLHKKVSDRFGLSCRMAEGICYVRLGPLSAEQIIKTPCLRGGVLATDDEIRKLLPASEGRRARGYLYRFAGVRMSKATWGNRLGNGSNCQNFFRPIMWQSA
jgi:hypothetical protein